jgi:hypothetical protein
MDEYTIQLIGTVATGIVIFIVLLVLYRKVLRPRLVSRRMKRLYELIGDWFDTINAGRISDLDLAALTVKEKKILRFIDDHGLKHHFMLFTPAFRQRFVQSYGLNLEPTDNSEVFRKVSECPPEGITIDRFWTMLMAAFYEFKHHYDNRERNADMARVANRVKLLKMYTGSPIK